MAQDRRITPGEKGLLIAVEGMDGSGKSTQAMIGEMVARIG